MACRRGAPVPWSGRLAGRVVNSGGACPPSPRPACGKPSDPPRPIFPRLERLKMPMTSTRLYTFMPNRKFSGWLICCTACADVPPFGPKQRCRSREAGRGGQAGESGPSPQAGYWGGRQGACCSSRTLVIRPVDESPCEFTPRPLQCPDQGTRAQRGRRTQPSRPAAAGLARTRGSFRLAQTARQTRRNPRNSSKNQKKVHLQGALGVRTGSPAAPTCGQCAWKLPNT